MAVYSTSIHGHTVKYDDESKHGMSYLKNDLSGSEGRVFFDEAKRRGFAEFEDDEDRQFTLVYQNGAYIITRRHS